MNNIFDKIIMTTHGPKLTSELVPYIDELIEYKTNRHLKLLNIKCEELMIFKITYYDTIISYIASKYPIKNKKYNVKLYPVKFNMKYKKLDPDPYTLGVLLVYGDFTDKFMNIPYNNTYNNYIKHKYHLENAEMVNDNKVYYRWSENDYYDELVTWNDFLGGLDNKVINAEKYTNNNSFNKEIYNIIHDIFPDQYMYSDLRSRYHILSGIFDVGYDKEYFDNLNGIKCKYINRLYSVSYMLRSIGILSSIYYYNGFGILRLIGNYFDFPKINYDIPNIIHQIDNINFNIPRDKYSSSIRNIEYVNHQLSYIPIFEDSDILYLDDKFLPVRSIY